MNSSSEIHGAMSHDPQILALLHDLLRAMRTRILKLRVDPAYAPDETHVYLVPDLSLWWSGANPQDYPAVLEKQIKSYNRLREHMIKMLPEMPEYIALHSFLADRYSRFTATLEGGLALLVEACLEDQFEQTSDARTLLWAEELSGSPVARRAKIFLPGILVKTGSITISEKLVLRAPDRSDFSREVLRLQPEFPRHRVKFGCIAEYSSKTVYGGEFQKEIEALVRCLSLIELASVFPSRYDLSTDALDGIDGSWSITAGQGIQRYTYVLEDDAVGFSASIEHLLSLVPSPNEDPYDPISIAYQRYHDAVCGAGSCQSVVFLAVSCLEALFSSDREELVRKLSFRVATLMREDGFDGLAVRKLVRDAYDVRSVYAHAKSKRPKGASSSPEQEASSIAPQILSIARYCLVRCAQLVKYVKRVDLESLLDDAPLDERERMRLIDLLANEWKPPIRKGSSLYALLFSQIVSIQ
jgi:hypothetical protein